MLTNPVLCESSIDANMCCELTHSKGQTSAMSAIVIDSCRFGARKSDLHLKECVLKFVVSGCGWSWVIVRIWLLTV